VTRETVTQVNAQTQLVRVQQQAERSTQQHAVSVNSLRTALGALAGIAAFKQIAQFGIDLDRSRNAMVALTGSTGAANAKLAELRDLAKTSPGVTATFATQLFQQLKAIGGIGDQTINNVIKSLGKLNTVFGDVGPDFARNLIQIFTQGFERADVKEALGRAPIFEQLLKSAFGTNDPDKLRQLQKAGQLTLGGFLDGLSNAVNNDPRLKNIGETLQGRLSKSFDSIKQQLGELGEKILQVLIPALEKLIPPLSKTLDFLNALPDGLKVATVGALALAPALNGITGAVGGLGAALARLGSFLVSPAGIAALAALGITVGVAGFQNLIAQNNAEVERRLNRLQGQQLDLNGKPVFKTLSDVAGFQGSIARGNTKPLTFFNEATGMFSTAQTTGSNALAAAKAAAGTSAAQDAANKALKKTFEDVAEMNKLLTESSNKRFDSILQDMEQLNTAIIQQTVADDRDARARRLLEQRQSRVILTQDFEQRAQSIDSLEKSSRRIFNRSGDFIGDAINRGQLTPGEAEVAGLAANRNFADELQRVLDRKRAIGALDADGIRNLQDEISLHQRLGTAISDSERFMRGFNSAIGTVGDAFERFGQNVSRAFTNVKDLFNGLKNAMLGFFNDLLGQSLQNLMRQVLAPIIGTIGGLGGIFGQPAAAGAAGGIFRTPGTFPAAISGSALQSIANAVSGGISVPASVSSPLGGVLRLSPSGGLPIPAAGSGSALFNAGANAAFGAGSTAAQFSLSGFGKSLAAAAPFLGFSIGGSLGGTSTAGNILSGIGGALGGLVLGASTGAIGGSLGSLFSVSGALGPAALVAAPLLIAGGILLGRAKQRHADEEASGQFLVQAEQALDQLATSIASDQVDGSQAQAIFQNQILGTFRQQISGLKTASVRDSRLKNQVADLQRIYDLNIVPQITAQQQRRANAVRFASIDSHLIPQFAGGGISRGGLAIMHPNEMVLTPTHQFAVRALAGSDIFERVGVPGVQPQRVFDNGGIMPSGPSPSWPATISIFVSVGITQKDAQDIVVHGLDGRTGEAIIIDKLDKSQTRGGRRV
jgi:hypothetical protein